MSVLKYDTVNFIHFLSDHSIPFMNRRFETLVFKLEVLDHKARERAGLITPTLGSPIPVLLQLGVAIEVIFCFDCLNVF